MDFFTGQEALSTIQWAFRGIFGFIFLLVVAKMMGQRSISQLRFLDFVIALILGNIMAHPLSDEQLGMKGSMITTLVIVILYISFTILSLKFEGLRNFFDPLPIVIVREGKIIQKNLKKTRISIDFVLSELRKNQIDNLQKVAIGLWEPGGRISFLLKSEYQPLTPNDIQLVTKPINLSKIDDDS